MDLTSDLRHANLNRSLNITEDNNISSAISELNSNYFTYFGGNNNTLNNSTPNIPIITTLKSPRKKRQLATSI